MTAELSNILKKSITNDLAKRFEDAGSEIYLESAIRLAGLLSKHFNPTKALKGGLKDLAFIISFP